jgi:coenzyme PQQ precursor peptide PqqA
MWTKPEYTEMRFGFEVTMYIANRSSRSVGQKGLPSGGPFLFGARSALFFRPARDPE